MMSASCSAGPRAAASRETRSSSSSPQLPPPLLPAPRSASSPPERTSQPTTILDPREHSIRRSPVDALNENRARSHTAESSNDLHPRIPRPNTPKTTNRALPVTPPTLQQPPPPPPSHEIPPSPQTPALATQLPSMVLPPQTTRRSPPDSSVSPEKGRTLLPSVPKSSSSEAISTLPPTTISHRHGQDSMHVLAVMDDCQSGQMKATSPYLNMSDKAHMNPSHLLDPGSTAHFSPVGPFPTTKTVSRPATTKGTTPLKSRRVRTGCLTCRERHLKCDEGVPDCFNCKKGNRECKRGLRLNFIDIQAKPIPYVPPVTEWDVSFLDESRLIASEYAGGLARYPRTKDRAEVAPRDAATAANPVKRQQMLDREDPNSNNRQSGAEVAVNPPPPSSFYQTGLTSRTTKILPGAWHQPTGFHPSSLPAHSAREPTQAGLQALLERGASGPHSLPAVKDELMDRPCGSPFSETSSISSMVPQGMGPSSVASFQADIGNSRTSVETESVLHQDSGENTGLHHTAPPEGLPTPPYEKTGLLRSGRAEAGFGLVAGFEGIPSSSRGLGNGEREYLDSPDEVLYMQVFVEDVGVWMDALDKDMHFSRIIPYLALKSPMMLNAFLACGIKRLALVDAAHQDGKAQYYYDTATTQLLLSLKNPDRDVVECATTAVVLNVYETMSDKPSDRMMHDVGARTLILDCGWNSRSKGIGSACFWLNIGMEILSCLAFNWQMAWEPDQWGLDTSFTHAIYGRTDEGNGHGVVEGSESSGSSRAPDTRTRNPQNHGHKAAFTLASHADTTNAIGVDDETWVHRIYYIVAKIANFRARAPRFQEPSPHDEQARLEHRHSEWKRLRDLCDMWNRECPQSMHPFGYLYPTQSAHPGSVFPNIWLVKRTAIIGRLCYHTAKILLHQVNPADPFDSPGNLAAQRHHARQVCGIVAHTKDRGVTDLAIRSLAISAHVLTDVREQDEVLCLLRKMSDKTGCRTDKIYDELQHVWGRGPGPKDLADATLTTAMAPSPPGILPPPYEPLPAGGFASAFGAAHNPGSGPALPMPFSWYRGSMVSLSPSATQLPPPGSGGAGCLGRPHHMRMYSTASMASNTSLLSAATAGSSPHLSPLSAAMPYRHPIVNPLMHTDASLPGHPYYLFYRRPNVSSQNNSQSQAC